jgi:hypothetical protein
VSTIVWVTVTFTSTPTDRDRLISFYKLVRPAGPGWNAVRAQIPGVASPDKLTMSLVGWILGITFVYSALFGTGSFLYGRTGTAGAWFVAFVLSGIGLLRIMPKLWAGSED